MEEQVSIRIKKALQEHVFPGCVVGIISRDGTRHILPFGFHTYDNDSNPVKTDSIYDLASITKSIPGSSALMVLIDKGPIKLDDRVIDYIPEFGNSENKKNVTIKHILTYTLDLDIPATSQLKDKTADEILNLICSAPIRTPPGEKFIYTNSTATLISIIIEKVTGTSLDIYAEELFFKPLMMNRTTFFPDKFTKAEIVPTEIDEWRGRLVHGEVHDESTFVVQQKHITAAAGLFSTAPDILKFLEMLLQNGVTNGKRYFSESMVTAMYTHQFPSLKTKVGLGWVIDWPEAMGTKCSSETFCKSGFTGTFAAIDPVKGIAYILLSNRVYPKRPPDTLAINAVRRDISDIIFQ